MSRSLNEESGVVPIGRPREFDKSKAIDSAMLLFWRNGYEGTSISDLTEALGITRPSLYAAFGNKEQLFRTVLDRYDEGTAEFLTGSLDLPTAREVAEGLLRGAAIFHSHSGEPARMSDGAWSTRGLRRKRPVAAGNARPPSAAQGGNPRATSSARSRSAICLRAPTLRR